MFCNFCGSNFEIQEGYEECSKGSHKLIRCEHCSQEGRDEEYDWRSHVRGEFSRGRRVRDDF